MLNSTGNSSLSLQRTTAASDTDARFIVLIVRDLATYLCRSGETHPFFEDGPIPAEVLGYTSASSSSLPETVASSKQKAALQLVSRLRDHVLNRNIVVIFPIQNSSEYRERLLMFLFEKLGVRTIIALSDVVADTFAVGLRDSLVFHASLRALSVSRVESGVSVKYAASASGSLLHLLRPHTTGTGELCGEENFAKKNAGAFDDTKEGDNWKEDRVSAEKGDGNDVSSLLPRLSVNGSSFFAAAVNLLDETYRKALVAFFGGEVYQRVVSLHEHGGVGTKRRRNDGQEDVQSTDKRANGYPQDEGGGALRRLIAAIAGDTSLPVIVTGEALRVAPLLRKFLEEAVRGCSGRTAATGTSFSSSSFSSESFETSSSSTTNGSNSSESSSFEAGVSFQLQPLPLEDSPWMLSLLGGSLVSQLSLAELSKLRISRDDALLSKGSIIHWRSLL
ncbi:hypothetical protein BCY84_00925 [Trypanosoma cruzi cruzi]|nr:hypothetical protein BCY84_00925 [Trypanosoma cruzi cruzi]